MLFLDHDHVAGQQKLPTLKKTTGLCPSRCYYSIIGIVLSLDHVAGQLEVILLLHDEGLVQHTRVEIIQKNLYSMGFYCMELVKKYVGLQKTIYKKLKYFSFVIVKKN